MAIRVNSYPGVFKRTANLPASNSFSLWGWFRLLADRNTYSGFCGLANAVDGANYISINTNADGTELAMSSSVGGTVGSGYAIPLNTWHFFAITGNGTTATGYYRAITGQTLTSFTATQETFAPGLMEFGGDGYAAEYLDGEMHALGAADVVLTAAELHALSYFHEPQFRGIRSLNVIYPCIEASNADAIVDRSGNARNASATVGSLADSPPLLWRPPAAIIVIPAGSPPPPPAATDGRIPMPGPGISPDYMQMFRAAPRGLRAGNAQYSQLVSGAITPSALLAKLTGRSLTGAVSSAGGLLRAAQKVLAGALSSAGVLSAVKTALLAIVGTLASNGALARQSRKPLTGSLGSVGALSRRIDRALAGALSTVGLLSKRVHRALTGAIVSSATLAVVKTALISLAGSLAMSGALGRGAQKTVIGSLSGSGSLARTTAKVLTGSLSGAGSLTKRAARALAGTLASAGSLVTTTGAAIVGSIAERTVYVRALLRVVFTRTKN